MLVAWPRKCWFSFKVFKGFATEDISLAGRMHAHHESKLLANILTGIANELVTICKRTKQQPAHQLFYMARPAPCDNGEGLLSCLVGASLEPCPMLALINGAISQREAVAEAVEQVRCGR